MPRNSKKIVTAKSTSSKIDIRLEELGKLIYEKRKDEKLTLEQAYQQSGVSAATLSRLEQHYTNGSELDITPETRTLAAITQWLGVSIEQVMDFALDEKPKENLPNVVELHLRADPNLNSEAAQALASMFRLAYEQFSKLSESSAEDSEEETKDK